MIGIVDYLTKKKSAYIHVCIQLKFLDILKKNNIHIFYYFS